MFLLPFFPTKLHMCCPTSCLSHSVSIQRNNKELLTRVFALNQASEERATESAVQLELPWFLHGEVGEQEWVKILQNT